MSGELFSVHSRTIPVPVQPSNGLAIAGLVCGIAGIAMFNVILGPLAIIFGGIGWTRANAGAKHKGQAISGVVFGIVNIVLFGVLLVVASKNGGNLYFHVGG